MWLVFVVTVVIVTATISTSFAVIVVVVISTIVTFVAVTGSVVDGAVGNKIETAFWSGYLFMFFFSLEHQLRFQIEFQFRFQFSTFYCQDASSSSFSFIEIQLSGFFLSLRASPVMNEWIFVKLQRLNFKRKRLLFEMIISVPRWLVSKENAKG